MKRQILLGMMASLTVLGVSFLPVQAQKTTTNQPNSNLVNAITETIHKEFADADLNEIKKDITFQYTEVDLNQDGTKETLVSIQKGFPCNNRHCPVYIYQKNGNNYRFISYVFTSRGELQVAILPSRSKGWINIAAPVFTYEPREIAWRVFKFDGKKYQLTSQKLSSAPKHIVLRETSGSKYTFPESKERTDISQEQINKETSTKVNIGCVPKNNQSRILSTPNPNDIHPDWRGESYIGTSWSLITKEIIKNNTVIYLKGDLYSPRGGLINENVFVLENEWDCSRN